MTAREYLSQLKRIKALIQGKMSDITELRESAVSIGVPYFDDVKVQKSKSDSRMSDIICEYADMERNIRQDVAHLPAERLNIIRLIERLPPAEYDVIHKHYFQEMGLQEIADKCEKSYSWVTTMHSKALKHVDGLLEKNDSVV